MISFKLSSHQQQVKDVVHWFAENEMRPISLEADQMGRVPDDWLQKINRAGNPVEYILLR